MDFVQHNMSQIKNQIDCLPDQTNSFDVAKYLLARRSVLYKQYYLSLSSARAKLMAEGAPPRTTDVIALAINEAIIPLYPPPATFPVCLPKTPAQIAFYKKFPLKGPSPDTPMPAPYTFIGVCAYLRASRNLPMPASRMHTFACVGDRDCVTKMWAFK